MSHWEAIQAKRLQALHAAVPSCARVLDEAILRRRIHCLREGVFWSLFFLGLAVLVAPIMFPAWLPRSWAGMISLSGAAAAAFALFAIKLGSLLDKLVALRWTRQMEPREAALLVVWMSRHPSLRQLCLCWGASRYPGCLHAADFARIAAALSCFRDYGGCVGYAKAMANAHALIHQVLGPFPPATTELAVEKILNNADGFMDKLRAEAAAAHMSSTPAPIAFRSPNRL